MSKGSSEPSGAVVHPLVLLSIVDHYNRVASDTKHRVIGVLLGEKSQGVVHCTNSFALPFEEDDRDPKVFYVDHQYLDKMWGMFRKVNAREGVVGIYSTGPKLKASDVDLADLAGEHGNWPLILICDVQPREEGLPVRAYYVKEQAREDGTQKVQKEFINIPTEVGATEAEEVGVEHLLRDVKDNTISTLTTNVDRIVSGLGSLKSRLLEVRQYLEYVLAGKLPANHDIIYNLQEVLSSLPNVDVTLQRSFATKSNDLMLVMYVSSLIRSILALHNLIINKEERNFKEKNLINKLLKGNAEAKDGEEGKGEKDDKKSKEKSRSENGLPNGSHKSK